MNKLIIIPILIGMCALSSIVSFFGPDSTPTPSATAVMAITPTVVETPYPNVVAVVDVDKLNFRSCAGNICSVLRVLRHGDEMIITGCESIGDSIWCSAEANGITGYINASYIRFKP